MRFAARGLLVGCALVLGAAVTAMADRDCGFFPVWSTGDLEFSVDVVTFRESENDGLVQISCSIGNDQIRFVEMETGEAQGALRILAVFKNPDGQTVDRADRRVELRARSMIQGGKQDVIQVIQLERRVAPGRYAVKIKITDEHAPKVGIWYAIRGIKRSGTAEVEVAVPDFGRRALAVSDIALARSIRPDSTGGQFSRSGLEVIPNPSHIYGLRLAELPVYLEVYDGRGLDAADTLLAEYVIRDSRGERVLGQTTPFLIGADHWSPQALSIPLVGLPQASYELAVCIRDPQTLEKATASVCFDVMWSMLSWDRSLQDGLEELSLILGDEELTILSKLSPGDRERQMRDYWKRWDPTPETVQNESLQEYYRRLKYANQNYRAYQRGMFTDQGRIYVKYGPADDVRRDAVWGSNPGAVDMLNPGASHNPGSAGHRRVDESGLAFREMGIDETEREAARLSNLQTIGKTYEVWVYDRGGKPLAGPHAWDGSGRKMKFVFVDQRGYGDLDLVYSSQGEDY
ncbi:MAG: GWxTD domain-containing protein [Candidatus Eisenbacteria sp.]|nr:GWxTD domain-containing protein [Candidatus Eisenbacteria bacterium]